MRAFVAHNGVDAVKSMLEPSSTGAAPAPTALPKRTAKRTKRKANKKTAASRIRPKEPDPELDPDTALSYFSEPAEQPGGGGDSGKELAEKIWSRTEEKEDWVLPGSYADASGLDGYSNHANWQSGTVLHIST